MGDQVVAITLTPEEVAWLDACGFTPGTAEDDVFPFPSETVLRKLWAALPAEVAP